MATDVDEARFQALAAATENWARARDKASRLEWAIFEARELLAHFTNSNQYNRDVYEAAEVLRQAVDDHKAGHGNS